MSNNNKICTTNIQLTKIIKYDVIILFIYILKGPSIWYISVYIGTLKDI